MFSLGNTVVNFKIPYVVLDFKEDTFWFRFIVANCKKTHVDIKNIQPLAWIACQKHEIEK